MTSCPLRQFLASWRMSPWESGGDHLKQTFWKRKHGEKKDSWPSYLPRRDAISDASLERSPPTQYVDVIQRSMLPLNVYSALRIFPDPGRILGSQADLYPEIVRSISALARQCIVRLSPEKVHFIVPGNEGRDGIQVWSLVDSSHHLVKMYQLM